MIAIIDYGMGNVRSLYNALQWLGADAEVTADHQAIRNAERLILPGVGAFGDAMAAIRSKGLDEILEREVRDNGKPLFGICLGMQLLARNSAEHGEHLGLGWIDATVQRLSVPARVKVPHVGWSSIAFHAAEPLFAGLPRTECNVYFVHSYHVICASARDVIATCEYGSPVVAAVRRENLVATQFHPEKSQDNGLRILENFIAWSP